MSLAHRPPSLDELRSLVDSPLVPARDADARFVSVEVEAGLFLLSREMAVDTPFVFESESFPACTLSVVLDGEATSQTRGVEAGFRPNEVWIASDNERRPCRTVLHATRPVRTVELVVTPEWFAASARTEAAAFDPLRAAMEQPLAITRRPLDTHLRRIASQVLQAPATPGLAALVLESRALDMLVALVDALGESGPQTDALRGRDRDRIMAVRARIDADPAGIVSLAGLAEEFGVSASKLKRDFFCAFATCAGAYVNERRLLLGRALIEREGLSVSQASYRAGYGHPSNFSTAFRRRFGFAPSHLRR